MVSSRTREILSIGRRLWKSSGYYEWCEENNIDPDTGELIKDGQ